MTVYNKITFNVFITIPATYLYTQYTSSTFCKNERNVLENTDRRKVDMLLA